MLPAASGEAACRQELIAVKDAMVNVRVWKQSVLVGGLGLVLASIVCTGAAIATARHVLPVTAVCVAGGAVAGSSMITSLALLRDRTITVHEGELARTQVIVIVATIVAYVCSIALLLTAFYLWRM